MKNIQISILGKGSYFGECEIFEKSETRVNTMICHSATSKLFKISKSNLFNMLLAKGSI